ncbi:hypothetical protein D3Z42_15590 [Lachnospiraceae bacterium]|nr:hypothetical protein [Lachnospiraceae bacterium]NBI76844.1 hypothetical protein [Lachnospiraceae bacterium]
MQTENLLPVWGINRKKYRVLKKLNSIWKEESRSCKGGVGIMAVESVYGLMSAYQSKHPDSHYFDHDTLKFCGEHISEMHLFKNRVTVTDTSGEKR